MGSRNLNKWFTDEISNIDHIAAIFVGITQGDAKDLNTQAYDLLPSIWYTLSKHIFKSNDVVHRMRLSNMWLDNRKGLRDKYYALAQRTPNTPKIARRFRQPSIDSYRCFCEKQIKWNTKVSMIMCDNCASFYHEICVQRGSTGAISSFVCPRCTGDPSVPPIFLLTPDQASMVHRRASTLIESSQLTLEDNQADEQDSRRKPQPKRLDAEFALSTTSTTIKKETELSDSVTSAIQEDEHSDETSTHSKLLEIEEITDYMEHSDNDTKNEKEDNINQKPNGFAAKAKQILKKKFSSLTKREPKKDAKIITIEELERVIEHVKNRRTLDATEEGINLETIIGQKSSKNVSPPDKIGELYGHVLYDDENDGETQLQTEQERFPGRRKGSTVDEFDDQIPSDIEIEDFLKTPSESDSEGPDMNDFERFGDEHNENNNNHFDNDIILEERDSSNEDDSSENNDAIGTKPNKIFEPFTIFIERETWKKIMHIQDKKIELDNKTCKVILFHSINPKNFHDTLYDHFMKVWPACTPTTTKTEIKQPNQLINSTAAYLRVYADCNRKPVCTAKYAFTLPSIPDDNEDDVEFRVKKTKGIVAHAAHEQATRQIRGEKRDNLKQRLKTEYPSTIRNEAFADADEDILEMGNFTAVPGLKAMQNICAESKKELRLSDDDFYDLHLTAQNMESEHGKTVKGYIRSLSAIPFRVVLFTEANLRAFRLVNTSKSGACLFFDATSTIVMPLKPPHDTSRPFLYTLLLKGYAKHKPCPIAEMVTTNQTTYNISVMLSEFFHSYRTIYVDRRKYYGISQVETDFSKAIIAAVLLAIEKSSTEDYLKKLWGLMKNPSKKDDVLALHVCRWHFHKFFSKYLKVVLKGKPQYSDQIRLWTAWSYRLVTMKDLWTFHRLVEDVAVILSDKYYSDEVRHRVESINKRTNRNDFPFWKDFVSTTSDESPLYLRSPFGLYADTVSMKIIEKRAARTKNYNILNPFKNHTLLKYIMRNIFPYAPILSHSVFQIKGIPVIHDTQGHIENYFKLVKHGKMHRKKARTVGDFVRSQAVYTKGECTRFLVELPFYSKRQNPKDFNARDNEVVTEKNLPRDPKINHTSGNSKQESKPGSGFILPGKQPKSNTKKKDAVVENRMGNIGNLKKSSSKYKSMQDIVQMGKGSLENLVEASKKLGKKVRFPTATNWKSADNLLETADEYQKKKSWTNSLKKALGSSEKSKPISEQVKTSSCGEKNPLQDKMPQSDTQFSSEATTVPTLIHGDKERVQLNVNYDSDESDRAIPKPSKKAKEQKVTPELKERFKPEQRRKGAQIPSTFLTLMPRLPWGGAFKYNNVSYKFSNTCPLDNFLQIFYALYEHNDKGRNFIDNLGDPAIKVLKESIAFIKQEKFATSKAHWLINTGPTNAPFSKYLTRNGVLDLYDCQSELAWNKIYQCFPVFEISWCQTKFCPANESRSRKIILVDSLIRNNINDTIGLFNNPYPATRNCEFCHHKTRHKIIEFLDPSPDIFFYECEGWTSVPVVEDGVIEEDLEELDGEEESTKKPKPSNIFVPTCFEADMVLEQNLGGVIYDVFAYTLKDNSRNHFVTVFVENGKKILYDGLQPNSFNLYEGALTVCSVVLVKR